MTRRALGFADVADHEVLAPVSASSLTLPYVVPTTTAQQRHRAALTVVRQVRDRAECRELLAMLGLDGVA